MRSSEQGDMLQHYYTAAVRTRQSGKLHETFPTASHETQALQERLRCGAITLKTKKAMTASTA